MNPSKIKGTRFETAVATYLCSTFPTCERRALRGRLDGGDLAGLPATIECKNTKGYDPAGALDEARRAAANNGDVIYAAVIKRKGVADVGESIVVLPLHLFSKLLWEATA